MSRSGDPDSSGRPHFCARHFAVFAHTLGDVRRFLTRKLHKRLHIHRTFDEQQVDLNEKAPTCGAFAEPSDGLEPSTPSLPWRIRAAESTLVEQRLPRISQHLWRCAGWSAHARNALTCLERPRTCPQHLSPAGSRNERRCLCEALRDRSCGLGMKVRLGQMRPSA